MDSRQTSISRRRLLTGALASSVMAQTRTASADQPVAADAPRDIWDQARAQWVLNARLAYFDTANFAPATRALLVAEYRALEALHVDPQGFFSDHYHAAAVQSLYEPLSRWLQCSADELCFTSDAAAGLQRYARQLSLQAGDEVIIHAQLPVALREFWNQQARDRGVVVKTVELPMPLASAAQALAAFENALSERSRVLMCSHVQAGDGAILPIRELCSLARRRGMLSLIDGRFALGALRFSLRELGCDAYGSSLAHWLNGPAAGLLYVRRELQDAINTSYRADQPVDTQAWPHLAGLWPEGLIAAAAPLQALPVALDFQEKFGRARIEARLLQLQTYARLRLRALPDCELLTPNLPGMYLQLLALRSTQRSAAQLANWLRDNDQVIVGLGSINAATKAVRISLNFYNSYDDIDRLALGLQRALRA